MTETTMPYSGPSMDGPDDGPEPDANRGKVLLLAGVAAALVVAMLAYFLLFAGDDSADPVQAPQPTADAAAAPVPSEAPAAEEAEQRISAKSFGRDPFKVPAAVVAAREAATAPVVEAPVNDTTDGSVSDAVVTSTYRFQVVDVALDNSSITVDVNGEVYENLQAGEVFADVFKVRLISGQVNSFQFGEETFNVRGRKAMMLA